MSKAVSLKTGLGEVMEPGTLLTVLILSPQGMVTVDPGALHGRSEVESTVQFVQQRGDVPNPQVYWLIWVAVELDPSQTPTRYKGLSASELWIDQAKKVGYKVLAENVNRMSEAMWGGVSLKTLDGKARAAIRQQLVALASEVWERSSPALKEALS